MQIIGCGHFKNYMEFLIQIQWSFSFLNRKSFVREPKKIIKLIDKVRYLIYPLYFINIVYMGTMVESFLKDETREDLSSASTQFLYRLGIFLNLLINIKEKSNRIKSNQIKIKDETKKGHMHLPFTTQLCSRSPNFTSWIKL